MRILVATFIRATPRSKDSRIDRSTIIDDPRIDSPGSRALGLPFSHYKGHHVRAVNHGAAVLEGSAIFHAHAPLPSTPCTFATHVRRIRRLRLHERAEPSRRGSSFVAFAARVAHRAVSHKGVCTPRGWRERSSRRTAALISKGKISGQRGGNALLWTLPSARQFLQCRALNRGLFSGKVAWQ